MDLAACPGQDGKRNQLPFVCNGRSSVTYKSGHNFDSGCLRFAVTRLLPHSRYDLAGSHPTFERSKDKEGARASPLIIRSAIIGSCIVAKGLD